MVKNRLLVNHSKNTIQLFWQRDQSVPRSAPAVDFHHPFSEEALAELRWYLEDYLGFPYGLEPEKAKQTEKKIQEWGKELFKVVFPRSSKAWDFFQEATREGLDKCELCISSDDPSVLNLPWELIYDTDYQFLSPALAGMYRSLNSYAVRAEITDLPENELNILLVIARPYGEKDISLKTIAQPILESLRPIQKKVYLKVLRPPSFEQFERELNENKGFYHIVHFDGHGSFDPNSQGLQHSLGGDGQGVLIFENLNGTPQIITASQIAQSLVNCRVPIFMLNACKSAQEGEEIFSSVATRLIGLGAKGVVAMAYSVYAEAAKYFIGRVYEQLVMGSNLSEAVASGRRELINKRQRPSPKGYLPLQDWMIPVLYQQENYSPLAKDANDKLDLETFLEELPPESLIGESKEGTFGFVGRDYDILQLERSLRQNPIVLLQGLAGVGKTQLAIGFSKWLIQTRGRSLCFFNSFEYGANFVSVIYQVGRTTWGDQFSQYEWEMQKSAVLNYLKSQPCLLIFDNFESLKDSSSSGKFLLTESECEDFKNLLHNLQEGKTWILITSRKEEAWLECNYTFQELSGLHPKDAKNLASEIFGTVGIDRSKLSPKYLDLLEILSGNPLALRVILPYLKRFTPEEILESIKFGLESFQEDSGAEKENSLTVSLDYSFSKLSEKTQLHLPFLALFSARINVSVLSGFSQGFDGEDYLNSSEDYREFFGEKITKADWLAILSEANQSGILSELKHGLYELHPVLPWHLRQKLLKNHTPDEISKLENKILIFYMFHGIAFTPEYNGNSTEEAYSALLFEEPNMLRYMSFAEQNKDWDSLWTVFTGLGSLYNRLGLWDKFLSLGQQLLKKLGDDFSSILSSDEKAVNLYIFIKGAEAYNAVRIGDFEKARKINQEILDGLSHSKYSILFKEKISTAKFNLGIIETNERDFDEATKHCQEAIVLYKEVESPDNTNFLSSVYAQLGIIARLKYDFYDALGYFNEAMKIAQEKKDSYKETEICYELAEIYRMQGNFNLASEYALKVIGFYELLCEPYKMAAAYDLLGMIYRSQKDYQKSIFYYRKALQIYENEGDEYNASDEYQGLGQVLKELGQLEESIAYFEKALEIRRNFEEWRKVAATLVELGGALEIQQNLARALNCYISALLIDFEHGREFITIDLENLARLLKSLDEKSFKEIWQKTTGQECPQEIYSILVAQ